MPLVDANLAATWGDSFYSGGYVRANKARILGGDGQAFGQGDHFKLKDALNLQPGQRIALIGAGFGWVAEDWAGAGLGPIVAADVSTWIQANKGANATVTILNEDGSTTTSRRNIKVALGGSSVTVDWAITEDVLPFLSDAECVTLSGRLRQLATNVAHWVTVASASNRPEMNNKTLAQWKALVTPDEVVQRGTALVL